MNNDVLIQPQREPTPEGEYLQQKNLGDIIADTFKIYFKGFLKFFVIVAVVQGIVYGIAILWILPDIIPSGPELPGGLFLGEVLVAIVSAIPALWMESVLIHTAAGHNLRDKSSLRDSMLVAWRRMARILGVAALVTLLVVLAFITVLVLSMLSVIGLIILIVVGVPVVIYLSIQLSLILHAVVIEGAGPFEAFSRSSQLVRDNWWRTFGILLVTGIIIGIIGFVLNFALILLPVVGTIIVAIITTPLSAIAYTLLYYDLRSRDKRCTIEEAIAELDSTIESDHYYSATGGPTNSGPV